MRRAVVLLLVALAPLGAGCGGTPPPAAQPKVALIERFGDLPDAKLARLCPSLYPSDFLRRRKHYRYDERDLRYAPTARQRAAARAAGCPGRGTKPQD